jgi:hypothetical protein
MDARSLPVASTAMMLGGFSASSSADPLDQLPFLFVSDDVNLGARLIHTVRISGTMPVQTRDGYAVAVQERTITRRADVRHRQRAVHDYV